MAVVAEGERGRVYLNPSEEMEQAAAQAKPEWKPDAKLPTNPRDFKTPNYGMTTFADLFTPRQLVALTTFSDLVAEARERVQADARAAGLPDDGVPLRSGGRGAQAYAEAVSVYLGMCSSRLADSNSSLARWSPAMDQTVATFARQALPMIWVFSESNLLAGWAGDFEVAANTVAKTLEKLPTKSQGTEIQADAASNANVKAKVISTDPPYYDNIGYADLSIFFMSGCGARSAPSTRSCSPRCLCPKLRNSSPRRTDTAARNRPKPSSWTA